MSKVEAAATEICDAAPVGLLVRLMADSPDDEGADGVIALLRLISRKDAALVRFAARDTLDRLIALSQQAALPEVAKTAALIVSVALADDRCLAIAFPSESGGGGDGGGNDVVLDMLAAWVGTTELVDLQIAGAIGVGNFCRSDAHAARVGARAGLLDGLLEMSQHDWGSVKHAALSSLKNIAKLDANKGRLHDLGLPAHLRRLVQDPQAPIQYLAASLLRAVVTALPPQDVRALAIEESTLLPRLVHLSRSEETAVKAEATRALLNLAKYSRSPEVRRLERHCARQLPRGMGVQAYPQAQPQTRTHLLNSPSLYMCCGTRRMRSIGSMCCTRSARLQQYLRVSCALPASMHPGAGIDSSLPRFMPHLMPHLMPRLAPHIVPRLAGLAGRGCAGGRRGRAQLPRPAGQ